MLNSTCITNFKQDTQYVQLKALLQYCSQLQALLGQHHSVLLIKAGINSAHHQLDQPHIWGQYHTLSLVLFLL